MRDAAIYCFLPQLSAILANLGEVTVDRKEFVGVNDSGRLMGLRRGVMFAFIPNFVFRSRAEEDRFTEVKDAAIRSGCVLVSIDDTPARERAQRELNRRMNRV